MSLEPQDLVRFRTAQAWTQAEMAARLGCSMSTVSRLETGRLAISAAVEERVRKLAGLPSVPSAPPPPAQAQAKRRQCIANLPTGERCRTRFASRGSGHRMCSACRSRNGIDRRI